MYAKDLGDRLLGVADLDVTQVRFGQDERLVEPGGGFDRLATCQRDGSLENGRRDGRVRELVQDHAAVTIERCELRRVEPTATTSFHHEVLARREAAVRRATSRRSLRLRPRGVRGGRSVTVHSGWKHAMVLPSGSLCQAERPMTAVVTTSSKVSNAPVVFLEPDSVAGERGAVMVDVGCPEAHVDVVGEVGIGSAVDQPQGADSAVTGLRARMLAWWTFSAWSGSRTSRAITTSPA